MLRGAITATHMFRPSATPNVFVVGIWALRAHKELRLRESVEARKLCSEFSSHMFNVSCVGLVVGLRGKVAQALADLAHGLAVLQLQLADQPVPATTPRPPQHALQTIFGHATGIPNPVSKGLRVCNIS